MMLKSKFSLTKISNSISIKFPKKRNTKNFSNYFCTIKVSKVDFLRFSLTKINSLILSLFFFFIISTTRRRKTPPPIRWQRARRSSSHEYRAFIHAYQDRCSAHIYYWLLRRASKIHRIQRLQFHYRALVASRRVSDSICTRMR